MTARFRVERFDRAEPLLDLLAALPQSAFPTAFQCRPWLERVFACLAAPAGARTLGLVVRDARTDALAAVLPLCVAGSGPLTTAELPDFGVSDYKAPILGPAAPRHPVEARDLILALTPHLSGVDVLSLKSMPSRLGDSPNPFDLAGEARSSAASSHALRIEGTLEEFLRTRDRKYRAEIERCQRLLEKAGRAEFRRLEETRELADGFRVLEEQQSSRMRASGATYTLDRPEVSEFYRSLLLAGTAGRFAHLFTLAVDGEPIAALYAVEHQGVVTLLRYSMGDSRWLNLSPGRMITMHAFRYFLERGVRTFDFGIGDYPYKRSLGLGAGPLVDFVAGLTWRGKAHAALIRAKARARKSARLKALADRLRGRR